MKIIDVIGYPLSVRLPPERQNTLGLGKLTKRDATIIKIVTDEGIIGWGEAHHARSPGAVAHIINTTMRDLVMGMDASQTTAIWDKVYKAQIGSHGMGAGSVIALSGIDMALWDIKGKAANMPLYKLLGGSQKPIPAYAGGGGALGFRTPEETVEEVGGFVEKGFRAVKLRLGQTNKQDIARISAVRERFPDLTILTDANTAYSLDDCRRVMPAMEELDVYWLEEPFPATNTKAYEIAATFSSTQLALGENSYTRFEFIPHLDSGNIRIFQPDVGKCGGVTEIMRIAACASTWNIAVHPHGGVTGLDLAAGIHVLASIENGGFFESSEGCNPLREGPFKNKPYEVGADGCVHPLEGPGIGLEVDEDFIKANPVIEGPGFV
ncbi:mandelate racemase/muconate lactonizing enzyme family protein [Ancylobacter mangrovi]|uniref:mandelate racemase/muconate lactonizing enzyme family protein n=1 Tax=Ancylobacter mangrovi TaxID=2972472 RepID=UPI0021620643|nr:mandelate racemase/muconate lactonizing enzyme family protein [Ancylobacter mangrovi]MCS0505010.1 mandelate racemase/muconate lactonizing enzyme family protein [Ancylobacter mangrovi]